MVAVDSVLTLLFERGHAGEEKGKVRLWLDDL